MLDNLMRLREPAAWTVIAVTAVSITLAVVRFTLALTSGAATLPVAAQDAALQAMNLSLVIVVVVLVWACVFHAPTPGARRLVRTAAWVVTIGTLVTVAGAVAGLTASAGVLGLVLEFLGGLLDIVLKILGATILWLMHRGLRGGRIVVPARTPSGASAEGDEGGAREESAAGADAEGEKPAELPAPAWAPEAATGAVWTTASEAAEGAPASGHGVPGAASGWHPVPRPAPRSEGAADSPAAPDAEGPRS